MSSRWAAIGIIAAALAALSCLAVWPAFHDPVEWTPDALYYQARVLELRGEDNTVDKVFEGPLAAELRKRDPGHTGNKTWVEYNEPFYERRVAVPLAAAALYPVTEERSLLDLSLVGYIAAVLALFGLLLLRFRIAVAAMVAVGAALLPPLTHHSSFPLTDSWGLALEIVALGAAILALERGLGWLPLWIGAIALLAFTRDSMWIPILAVGWCALRSRSRTPVTLFATGVAAALPALLLFSTPVRDLLALLVNDSEPSADTSLGIHREPLSRRARRAAPGERRLPPPRRVVHGALPRRRRPRSPAPRLAQARDPRHDDDADDRRGRARARLCACGPGLQRVPAGARLRADGRVGRRADRRACGGPPRRARRGAGAQARRVSSNPDAWIGRSELPALVRFAAARDNKDSGVQQPDGLTMRTTAAHTNRLWRGIPSWQRSVLATIAVLVALVQLGGSSAAPGDPPSVIGDWSAPVAWPLVAVHMSLEPTGQVFALDGFAADPNSERLWDPATGAFTPVPYGRNLFCSGHIQLADGRTLLVGGHINANEGLADTTLFNPMTKTYFRGPDMSVGRWYPTATAAS